jgi:predicted acetyltransferase
MSCIRKLEEKDIHTLGSRVWANAFNSEGIGPQQIDERKSYASIIINELDESNLYGCFNESQLIGAIMLSDYTMNLHSTKTLMGGLRAISVDLMHKKERTAMKLIKFACSHYKERGSCILALYPFRADFYKNMGFGFGTVLKNYKVKPKFIPTNKSKEHLIYWDNEDDRQTILDCCQRFVDSNHGMCDKTDGDIRKLFFFERRIIAYKRDGQIEGYINISFKTENECHNYLVVHEFVCETTESYLELCTFLHTQADQFEYIIFETQDEYMHFNFCNPANGNQSPFDNPFNSKYIDFCVSSIGMMYRIIDVKRYFEILAQHNFNNQTCRLKFSINDTLFTPNNGSIVVSFVNGFAKIESADKFDAEINFDISEFSSLAMGAINFKTLLKYGLVSISDSRFTEVVDRIFGVSEKPKCNTFF